jgi:hypothetical protein
MKSLYPLALLVACTGAYSQAIPLLESNGAVIGYWMYNQGDDVGLVTPKGYAFELALNIGRPQNYSNGNSDGGVLGCRFDITPFHLDLNCQGPRILVVDSSPGTLNYCGKVAWQFFLNSEPYNIYYSPDSASVQTRVPLSRFETNGQCTNIASPVARQTLIAIPNDPNVTGIRSQYQIPARSGEPSGAGCLFRDGFEICQ